MKAKLTCTMYLDYERDYWDFDKPDAQCRAGYDYLFLRKGSIFTIYSTPEKIRQISSELGIFEPLEIDEKFGVICADKKGNWFGYENLQELEKARYWEIIDDD